MVYTNVFFVLAVRQVVPVIGGIVINIQDPLYYYKHIVEL